MTKEQKALLELIRIAVTRECSFTEALLYADWNELLRLSAQQSVSCLCMDALETLHRYEVDLCPTEVKLQLYARKEQIMKHSKKRLDLSAEFASAMQPMKLVALKGIDYARYWPNPLWREFGDLDCCAVDCDGEVLDKKAVEIGCRLEDGGYKHSHLYYKNLSIENHYHFTRFAGSKEGVCLEKELRELFAGNLNKLNDSCLFSPCSDFTAVFMIAHAQNHFFYEGLTLRQILDWQFFVKKEHDNINWDRVNDILKRTNLSNFYTLLTCICEKYSGLDLRNSIDSIDDEFQDKFLVDIFEESFDDTDRRWYMMIVRLFNRYVRMWKFRNIMKYPVARAIWRSIYYSSVFHRNPELI